MKATTILEGLYGAFLMALLIPLNPFLRKWHLTWGCTKEETNMTLPGDGLVKVINTDATHAITINRPAKEIWPWLVQIGAGRGGFYSYDFLENLVGCNLKSASSIVPEWQNVKQGDIIYLHPKAPLMVSVLIPNESFVLGAVWGFHLKPIDKNSTRLIIRARGAFETGTKNPMFNFIVWHVIYEPIHFIMERKMMLNIRRLAENN